MTRNASTLQAVTSSENAPAIASWPTRAEAHEQAILDHLADPRVRAEHDAIEALATGLRTNDRHAFTKVFGTFDPLVALARLRAQQAPRRGHEMPLPSRRARNRAKRRARIARAVTATAEGSEPAPRSEELLRVGVARYAPAELSSDPRERRDQLRRLRVDFEDRIRFAPCALLIDWGTSACAVRFVRLPRVPIAGDWVSLSLIPNEGGWRARRQATDLFTVERVALRLYDNRWPSVADVYVTRGGK